MACATPIAAVGRAMTSQSSNFSISADIETGNSLTTFLTYSELISGKLCSSKLDSIKLIVDTDAEIFSGLSSPYFQVILMKDHDATIIENGSPDFSSLKTSVLEVVDLDSYITLDSTNNIYMFEANNINGNLFTNSVTSNVKVLLLALNNYSFTTNNAELDLIINVQHD